ncbi:4F5 protein family domain-containing protein [Ditylenchus destructor]|uniref:4F5 protein family domain-containing protein n=1 Tax=Ditylenchus destructor TaxID=166010 RepID=A0AAD4MYN4_9BILA|nr:4F5 protein family domain-containing protein [Ditylenchus destructor]
MTRGNQRELARAKNAKRNAGAGKPAAEQSGNKGLSTDKRLDRDAEAMRIKQQKALEKKQAEDAAKAANAKKVVKVDPLKDL